MNKTRMMLPLGLLALLLILIAGLPRAAWAGSLSKYSATTEPKKVVLTFTFSEAVDYEPVFHYKDNYVALKVKGLKFSRSQLNNGAAPKGEEQKACFRKVAYTQLKGEGEIRIALNKKRNPGDVQVAPEDSVIRVEILLPTALVKTGGAEDAGDSFAGSGADAPSADREPAAQDTEPGPTSWPPEDSGSGSEGAPAAETETGEAEVADDPAGFRDVSADAEVVPEDAAEIEAADEGGVESGALDAGLPIDSGPSYKNFDLSTVPVSQRQFANIPLNEAVMLLVGDSGFNVVVGAGVSNTPVTLNFNQNQMSLQRALRALCMAYDLEYTVEDDVIIVRGI